MLYKELTTKSKAELEKELLKLKEEMHALSVKVRLNEEKQTHKLKNFRQDIARIMTVLKNK